MKWAARTWMAIVVGAVVTVGAASVGLANLQRVLRSDAPAASVEYFLEGDRLTAPLVETEVFTSPRTGYDGRQSGMTTEFLPMLAGANAEQRLVALALEGASGARLYGLCGLRLIGSKALGDDPLLLAREDHRRVALIWGCGLSVSTPRKLLEDQTLAKVCDLWGQVRARSGDASGAM